LKQIYCFLTEAFTISAYYIKVNGFGAYLKKVLLSIAKIFVKHGEAVLFEKNLSEIPGFVRLERRVNIEIGTPDDVPGLTQLLPRWPARIFHNRLSQGDVFFIAQVHNQIIHQVWLSFRDKWVPFLDKRIVLREGEAYLYQSYTAAEFRGNNILPATTSKVLRYLKAQGYKRLFFMVDLKAHRSARAYERISTAEKGTVISYWRILGWRSYRYAPYE
jgi:RimJ/RimL family protein N-acetyltransferase